MVALLNKNTLLHSTLLIVLCFAIGNVTFSQEDDTSFLNEDLAPDSLGSTHEYSPQHDAYVRDEKGGTLAYRRLVDTPGEPGTEDGEALIQDEIITQQLGTITIEQVLQARGVPIYARPQPRFSEVGERMVVEGLRTYFLLSYQKVYGISAEEAEQYLADNIELPITWQHTFLNVARSDIQLIPAVVRSIRPQSGVSFVLLEQPYRLAFAGTQPYPSLYSSFAYSDRSPGHTFGLDAEPGGRLVVYFHQSLSNYSYALEQPEPTLFYGAFLTSHIVTRTMDAYRFTEDFLSGGEAPRMTAPYHMGWLDQLEAGSDLEQIYMAFGMWSFAEMDNFYELPMEVKLQFFEEKNLIDVEFP